jgi:hypothetical protein
MMDGISENTDILISYKSIILFNFLILLYDLKKLRIINTLKNLRIIAILDLGENILYEL